MEEKETFTPDRNKKREALELIKIINSTCEQGYQTNLVGIDREII